MHEELITELNAETDQSTDKLYDLINTTRNIMLRDPGSPVSPPETKKPLESGWKLAKEFQDADDYFGGQAEKVVEGLEPDQQIIQDIEALGEAVLDEAFECLGEDAELFLDVFKQSADRESFRMTVVGWLQDRIKLIKDFAEHQFKDEDSETYHYSATRLSPKLIGKYPDIKLKPTCLSGSILAMSFFHKTDLPMLHGNVSHSATQEFVRAQNASIDQFLRADYEGRIELTDQMKQRLLEVKESNDKQFRHNGFHASGFVKFSENAWLQMDTNGGDAWIHTGADNLDEIHSALSEQKPKGYSEGIFERQISERVFEDITTVILEQLPSQEEVTEIFDNTPVEEIGGEIVRKILKPYMPILEEENDLDHPHNDKLKAVIHDVVCAHGFGSISSEGSLMYMQWMMDAVVQEYVFHARDKEELYSALQRCQEDPSYKERRIADAQLAPLFMALKLHTDWDISTVNKLGIGKHGHIKAEVGLAPYRVGISVLSDTAAYIGDELPLSTWLTYWPSHVSYAEHQSQKDYSIAQATLSQLAIQESFADGLSVDDEIFEILEQVASESNWL